VSDDRLFEVPEEPPVVEKPSPGRRLTLRNNQTIANGRHPATSLRLSRVEGATCGTCVYSYKTRKWWKCELVVATSGPGTDIRKKWPGCSKWERR